MRSPSRRLDTVRAILQTRRGELLLIKRSVDYPLVPGGVWALFGGGMAPGEEPLAAARRELREELGLRPGPPRWRDSRRYVIPGRRRGVKHTFAFRLARDLSRLSLREGAGFALFTPAELRRLRLSPYDRPDIMRYLGENHG